MKKTLLNKKPFYQTREEYLEELECSQELENQLYDALYDSVESSSAVIEAAVMAVEGACA